MLLAVEALARSGQRQELRCPVERGARHGVGLANARLGRAEYLGHTRAVERGRDAGSEVVVEGLALARVDEARLDGAVGVARGERVGGRAARAGRIGSVISAAACGNGAYQQSEQVAHSSKVSTVGANGQESEAT